MQRLARASRRRARCISSPHRAVYDITFDHATPGSGVADMTGRMVYEMTGSSAAGYAQNMRFVTRMTNQEGAAQSTTCAPRASRISPRTACASPPASTRTRSCRKPRRAAPGPATATSFTEVKLTKPAKKTVKLPSDIYFPIQHSLALVEAARRRAQPCSPPTSTTAPTRARSSTRRAPSSARAPRRDRSRCRQGRQRRQARRACLLADRHRLLRAGAGALDALPTYELSFRFYENGVSSQLYIDYGDFAIRGELKELTFLEEGKCPAPGAPPEAARSSADLASHRRSRAAISLERGVRRRDQSSGATPCWRRTRAAGSRRCSRCSSTAASMRGVARLRAQLVRAQAGQRQEAHEPLGVLGEEEQRRNADRFRAVDLHTIHLEFT